MALDRLFGRLQDDVRDPLAPIMQLLRRDPPHGLIVADRIIACAGESMRDGLPPLGVVLIDIWADVMTSAEKYR